MAPSRALEAMGVVSLSADENMVAGLGESPGDVIRVSTASLARRLVEKLGGRYSLALGIDVDRGARQVERWALLATLFGNRISAEIVGRTYETLARAGVRTIRDAGSRSWQQLVALLDAGGYVRYDFRTATRLLDLAAALRADGDGIAAIGREQLEPEKLEAALDALPGWGPVTVRLFLRELRGVWPGAQPPLDPRALDAAAHLRLFSAQRSPADGVARAARLAAAAGLDVRDLETALVRLDLVHRRGYPGCAGGTSCRTLAPA
jgi:hypothetical protein